MKASWGEEALDSEDPAQHAISGYAETMGIPTAGNALTGNYGRWCRSFGGYIEAKCEAHDEKAAEDSTAKQQHKPTATTAAGKRHLGDHPQIVIRPILKPRAGDIRDMVLPGGGSLCLRVWSGIRRFVSALYGWHRRGATDTDAFRHHVKLVEAFLAKEAQHVTHAWDMLGPRENLRMHCELLFFLEAITSTNGQVGGNTTQVDSVLLKILDDTVTLARERGILKLNDHMAKEFAKN